MLFIPALINNNKKKLNTVVIPKKYEVSWMFNYAWDNIFYAETNVFS